MNNKKAPAPAPAPARNKDPSLGAFPGATLHPEAGSITDATYVRIDITRPAVPGTDSRRKTMSLMSRILMLLVLAVYAVTGTAAGESTTTPTPGKTNGEKWWRGKYENILSDIKKMDGKIDLAFVGDSITARWGGEDWEKHWGSYRAVNMGIGGDRTQNVLWRLENGQLDGYKARLFVLMIGTNNTAKNTDPADVAAGIKAILALIQSKQPQAKILLLGIFPRGEKPNPGREQIAAVNDLISKFAGGAVHYMDIGAKFLEPDGTISKEVMKDFLHLDSKGYDIWAEAIGSKVKELLGGAQSGQKTPAQP